MRIVPGDEGCRRGNRHTLCLLCIYLMSFVQSCKTYTSCHTDVRRLLKYVELKLIISERVLFLLWN